MLSFQNMNKNNAHDLRQAYELDRVQEIFARPSSSSAEMTEFCEYEFMFAVLIYTFF